MGSGRERFKSVPSRAGSSEFNVIRFFQSEIRNLKFEMEKGLIQVYTGNGKGKTTAALGLALRAVGHGLKVLVIQFMKGNIDYGELESSKKLSPLLTIVQSGRETFVSRTNPDPVDIRLAQDGFDLAKRVIADEAYDIIILDEIIVAIDYGLIPLSNLLSLLDAKPDGVELILTGRNARPEILEKADLVTEMVEQKHYYANGVPAREGVEI